MRSNLFGENVETETADLFTLQNSKMLKVKLNGEVMARQGSMVAYQGAINFDYQGSGGIGKFLKKALTGEGVPLMKCSGQGDLFLANDADEIHLIHLDNETFSVSGEHLLAFEPGIQWDIQRLQGVSMLGGGGMFNMTLTGTGWIAVLAHGSPVVLRTDAPTFADAQAVVGWSQGLQVAVKSSVKLGSLIGRGSGEAFQLAFTGQGFVIVQASEGLVVPPHSHGG